MVKTVKQQRLFRALLVIAFNFDGLVPKEIRNHLRRNFGMDISERTIHLIIRRNVHLRS